MNKGLTILLILIAPFFVYAQSFDALKRQYQTVSPYNYQKLNSAQLVDPEASYTSAEEDRLAELKAQELAEKQARDEKVYLDTDFKFFQSLAVPLEEDELDKVFKKDIIAKDLEQMKHTDSTVKTEIKTTAPAPMSRAEGVAVDQRRAALMKKISENSRTIKACVIDSRKKGVAFKGTEMTLMWDVTLAGKVQDAKINSTDVADQEIQKCVLKSVGEWNFAEAMKDKSKRSRIQYTFKFTKEIKTDVVAAQN